MHDACRAINIARVDFIHKTVQHRPIAGHRHFTLHILVRCVRPQQAFDRIQHGLQSGIYLVHLAHHGRAACTQQQAGVGTKVVQIASRTANFVGMERSALHRKLKSLGVVTGAKGRGAGDVDEDDGEE